MCTSTVARVVALDGRYATVEFDGTERQAIALTVPDLAVGDLVLIGLGAVLGRIDEEDATALQALETELANRRVERSPLDIPGTTQGGDP